MTDRASAPSPTSGFVGLLRRIFHSGGADKSGLSGLSYVTIANFACDAVLAVALANTLFFSAATAESRSNVALYLLMTVAPFAILAPVIGPALDRLRTGRRLTLSLTFTIRACCAVILALNFESLLLYPLALAMLVLSKTFGVVKASITPQVLPPGMDLVQTNSRLTILGHVGGSLVGGAFAALIAWIWDSDAALWLLALIALVAAYLCFTLPRWAEPAGDAESTSFTYSGPIELPAAPADRYADGIVVDGSVADSPTADRTPPSEAPTEIFPDDPPPQDRPPPRESGAGSTLPLPAAGGPGRDRPDAADGTGSADGAESARPRYIAASAQAMSTLKGILTRPLGRDVMANLWAESSVRMTTGFLTLYLAFVAKSMEDSTAMAQAALLAAAGAAAGFGTFVGNAVGTRLTVSQPMRITLTAAGATVAMGAIAAWFAQTQLAVVFALVAAVASSLGKVALDASIQTDIPDRARSSAFGRSETALQLSWVFGGAAGVLLPTDFRIGFTVITIASALMFAQAIMSSRGHSLVPRLGGNRPESPDPARNPITSISGLFARMGR